MSTPVDADIGIGKFGCSGTPLLAAMVGHDSPCDTGGSVVAIKFVGS